jgi:hypothetical protein
MGDAEETERLVTNVTTSMSTLREAVHTLAMRQETQLRRTQRTVKWIRFGLITHLILLLVCGILYVQVQRNSDQLRAVNVRTSTQALCPLYELFLRSYNPQSPTAKQDPVEYERNFTVIEQGARVLGCAHVVRGR